MLNKVTEFEREEVSVSQSEVQNLSDNIKANEARMEKLVSTYLDGDIAKEMYLTRKDTLMRAILALKEKMKDFERGRNNWVEPLRNWILDLKQANFLSTSNDFHEIKSFVQKKSERTRWFVTNPPVLKFPSRPNSSRSDGIFCPHPRRRRGTSSTFRIRKFQSAERAGFEPAVRFDTHNTLAVCRFRPLSHLSLCAVTKQHAHFHLIFMLSFPEKNY